MTRRTIEAYEAALRYANTLIELDSQYTAGIIIDFENAMRTALKNVCPNIRVHGCLFHFMQAITRKVASIPTLFELVRNNDDARFLLRKFQSIALLPANKIKDEFASLVRETLGTHKFTQFATFVEYYKKQWINKVKPVHFSVFNLECRTTSPAEAFNGKINKTFRTHGSFFSFIESLQKEEAAKSDQFSRDVIGVMQPDRRKNFDKKRAELISKYSLQLEKRTITTGHFLNIMANVNNEILYDERIIFTNEIEVRMSIESSLMEGDDIESVPPPNIVLEKDVDTEIPSVIRTTRKRKRIATESSETVNSPKRTRSETVEQTASVTNIASDTHIQTRSKRAKQTASLAKATSTATHLQTRSSRRRIDLAEVEITETRAKTKKKRQRRPHETSDDDSNSDTDSNVYDVMERISRNGPAMVNLRKRFLELQNQEVISIDPDCFKCIICYERKKTTILMPCWHQHTCGPCWIMWKIQQINSVPLESVDDAEEMTKPKCPVCRQGVDEFKEAKN